MAQDPQERHRTAPHPVIAGFYDQSAHRLPFVRDLFNSTATHYDSLNRWFSLGSGARYRRNCLARAGLRQGLMVVDVAVGTGLLAREILAITGERRRVVGIDLSERMLAIAREKLAIPLVQGTAEALPIADEVADFVTMGYALRHVGDEVADFVTMGYALRHVGDLVIAFREFRRVLRRGGKVVVLELGSPSGKLSRAVASIYLGRVVPLLSRWTTGDARAETLMRYYWQTIEHCVPPDTILTAMADSGLEDVRCVTDLDLFRSYVGRKP